MNPWRWVDPRISAVQLSEIQSYFERHGWKLTPTPNLKFLRFELSHVANGEALFQVVPSSEQVADFRQRITELITTLSELEDRHPVAILEELLGEEEETGPAGRDSRRSRAS